MKTEFVELNNYGSASELVKEINDLISSKEEEGLDPETFSIDCDLEDNSVILYFTFRRPETEAELKERNKLEERQKLLRLNRYKELKKEFG